jgi:hypothetical protein
MEYIDFIKLDDDEIKIDQRLRNWAIWVRPSRGYGTVHPMFRWYRPTEHWQGIGAKSNCDLQDAEAVERVMRDLNQVERLAIKWYYIEFSSPTKICKVLQLSLADLKMIVKRARKNITRLLGGVGEPQSPKKIRGCA